MRVRTAKSLARRIDLYYFTRARGMRRWRYLLSAAAPLAALLWVSAFAAAGNRTPYSPGPVSTAHAFVEMRCDACHAGATATPRFRAHTTDAACLTCHDAPPHAANQTPPPRCAACHQDHRGRVQLAKPDEPLCLTCHAELKTSHGSPRVARNVSTFSQGHPEFAAARPGAHDPGRLRFNHAVHLKGDLRGPGGPERLQCEACHTPEGAPTSRRTKGQRTTGLMTPIAYQANCARCHPLSFDERLGQAAPHATPETVRAFVRQALDRYIRANPGDIARPDAASRRVPLNFPRPPEPPARNAEEWVSRRAAADERLLWNKTCAECHEPASATPPAGLPVYAGSGVTREWMPRAAFDHTPHLMVTCTSCHAAERSTETADVLMPSQAVCATCHAAEQSVLRLGSGEARRLRSGQAEYRCFECHRYHDWRQSRPVRPSLSLTDLK
jgi:predicted CXXCH cytochrome family protein